MNRVILAEDDAGILDVTKLILEKAGYEVTAYSTGKPLLERDFVVPDIFILDKELSGHDGLEICRFLKREESTRDIPVIMLSAAPHIGEMAREAGACDALEKPFSIKDLKDIVARYIRQDAAALQG